MYTIFPYGFTKLQRKRKYLLAQCILYVEGLLWLGKGNKEEKGKGIHLIYLRMGSIHSEFSLKENQRKIDDLCWQNYVS